MAATDNELTAVLERKIAEMISAQTGMSIEALISGPLPLAFLNFAQIALAKGETDGLTRALNPKTARASDMEALLGALDPLHKFIMNREK